jgi:hypothetical protein
MVKKRFNQQYKSIGIKDLKSKKSNHHLHFHPK